LGNGLQVLKALGLDLARMINQNTADHGAANGHAEAATEEPPI